MPMYSTIIGCDFDGLKATAEVKYHSNLTPTLDISVSSRDRIKSGVSFDLGSIKPRETDEEFKTIRLEKEFLQVSRQDRILFKLKLKELGSTYLDQEEIDVESALNRKRKLSNSLFSVLIQFCSEENLESDLLKPKSKKRTRKDPSEVFERAISWILALSGFNTIWLQDYEKLIDKDTRAELGSLDLIAYHPDVKAGSTHGDVYIIAECTTGSVEIQKIDGLIEVKRLLHERIFSDGNVTVVPVIFCSTLASTAKSQTEGHGVKLLDREDIRDLLMELKIYFATELMRKDGSEEYENSLFNLIRSTAYVNQSGSLGGNAVTLLFQLKRELPGDDWCGLNLDYADLSGADLSNKNFSTTSLRYANLDNVNFEGADFTGCDLTGVRIEETAPVLAIAPHPSGNRIIAAYGDNTIRQWNITHRLKNESHVIGKNPNGTINSMGICTGSDLYAMTSDEIVFYDFIRPEMLSQRARFRMKPGYRQALVKGNILLFVSEKEHQENKILLVDLHRQTIMNLMELKEIVLCENLNQQVFVFSEGKNSLKVQGKVYSYREKAINLQVREITSLCVLCCEKDVKYLVACGQANGEILIWHIDLSEGKWQEKLLLKNRAHDGVVSALAFLDDSRIVSGGIDRKICIIRFGPDLSGLNGIQEQILHRTVRCRGMKIEGIKGEREQEILRRLIAKAQNN
ncbi:MAG: pentapeptide repeat-containing protein [Candidatus Methanofastidiosia archaeon]